LKNKGNFVNVKPYVLYRPGKALTHLPLSLRSVGYARLPLLASLPDKRIFDFIQLIWCLSGKGSIEYAKQKINISEGFATAILPGKPHQIYALSPEWEIRWVTIDGLHACDIVNSFNLGHNAVKPGECPLDLFKRMESIVLDSKWESILEGSSLCYSLLTKAANSCPKKTTAIDKAMIMLRENAGNADVGISQIADQVGIERTLFSKKFISHVGMSPKEYLDSCRLEKIMSLLANTDETVIRIASQTGFANANYLGKFFRKKMNISPIEFRMQAFMEL
jgi:AraC-like DNA-binding protein